jgi:SAM-dependent methyltransferase
MRVFDLRAPKDGTKFVTHHDRLALFHKQSETHAYWSQYWLGEHTHRHLEAASTGTLDSGFDVFLRMVAALVPTGSTVLEGGCGPGHLVAALRARGYAASGIDYVEALVDAAKVALPDLDIRVGDVERLPFADGTFDCYASLGVIEHFENGPARAIAEAYRVVRPGGVAIFEVPYLNALRRSHLERLKSDRATSNELAFHQYYFGRDELTALLRAGGFTVLATEPNCWESVIFREHPIFARFWESPLAAAPLRRSIRQLVRAMPFAGRLRYAHTMAFACRRAD